MNRYRKVPTRPTDILNYYFRIRNKPQALNEAKLILVGYGSVGKTSVVNRLVHDRFDTAKSKQKASRLLSGLYG